MRIAVTAPRGKMGALIVQAIASRPHLSLVSVIAPKGRDYVGLDAGQVCGTGKSLGVTITDDWDTALLQADVLIDFSTVETARIAVEQTMKHSVALVCGTTGFSEVDRYLFLKASKTVPVLPAANTSRVIFLMKHLLTQAASELKSKADIELIEMHGRDKMDAPSGTSKELGHVICKATGQDWDKTVVFGRKGHGQRSPGELGYHSLRSGDISSSHTVLFGLLGERLEITHHAHNWRCFAEGALDCAEFMKDKGPGLYTVEDVFNAK